jgi:alpha-tubulin suppressor-like RCC1 family protein
MAAILRDAKNNILADRVVRWASSNPAIATIDSVTGVLTGLDRGTVTITATSETKTGSASRVIVIKYRSVAAGSMHACDIASGGFVWCWGLNGKEGRIGSATLGDNEMSSVPVLVPNTGPNALRFTQLSSYGTHTCGITTTNRAYCWGSNGWGQLGGGSNASQSNTPITVSTTLSFKQISTGADHSCAVTTDNKAYCWGHNDWREFASNTPAMSTTPVAVLPEMSFKSITAGTGFTCAISVTDFPYCWGASGLGQLGNGTPISYGNTFSATPVNVSASGLRVIDAALGFACALDDTNHALCWGSNGGRLGNGNGPDSSFPQLVNGGLSFASISSGTGFSCGVTTDSAVWCWGANDNGQLGVAAPAVATSPVRAGGSLLAAEVSVAGVSTGFGRHTCTISANRLTTYCFGRNETGQLGNGTTSTATAVNSTPTIVVGQKPLP